MTWGFYLRPHPFLLCTLGFEMNSEYILRKMIKNIISKYWKSIYLFWDSVTYKYKPGSAYCKHQFFSLYSSLMKAAFLSTQSSTQSGVISRDSLPTLGEGRPVSYISDDYWIWLSHQHWHSLQSPTSYMWTIRFHRFNKSGADSVYFPTW